MQAPRVTIARTRCARGFTLTEVMIVVAVLAILATVALPSFLDALRRGRRADAIGALTQVQQAQERWRANQGSYTDQLTTAAPNGLGLSATSARGYYAIAVSDAGANGYTVTATANSGTLQAGDDACRKLVLRQAGGNTLYSSVDADNAVDDTGAKRCWAR